MEKKYSPESGTPNWPIKLNPNKFASYCDSVIDGVTSGIERIINATPENDPIRTLDPSQLTQLKERWLNHRSELSSEELVQIQAAYELEVDYLQLAHDFANGD